MKPILKLQPQFQTPPPWRAYCHLCKQGFPSLDDLVKHNAESVTVHQK